MTDLLFRLLLVNLAALVPVFVLDLLAPGNPWQPVIAAVLAVGIVLFGAQMLVRRPVARLLAATGQRQAGDQAAGAAFERLGAALEACTGAHEQRERALREALSAAEQARAALAESEARLRLALGAAEVGVFEINVGQRCVWHDDRAAALTDSLLPAGICVPESDPRVRELLGRIHPDDRAGRRAALQAAIDGVEEAFSGEWRFRTNQGTWRWVSERGGVIARAAGTGTPLRIIGILRDITEQRTAAAALEREVAERTAALHESQRRFRSIFDSAFQLTGLLSRDGVVLEVNRAALDFLGLPETAVLGRALWDIGEWREKAHAVQLLKQRVARAAAGEFVRYESKVHRPDGSPATFDFSLKPVFAEDGEVAMLVAEARDLTERVQLQAQLAQAQKMEAVGQLTGGVAHDFNNLLQALTGNLDLIHRLAESRGDERLLRLADNAQRVAARGARLTQQLLAFSRRQNLRPEQVLVSSLICEMDELLRRTTGETIKVRTRAVADLWTCLVDPAQFESAVLNLAINARDAMPQGGTLGIEAENVTLSSASASQLEVPPGDYVRVNVTDTGVGIAPEHLPRLFEPFFTTKEVGKGTGLGLAMVHGFARQSGGAVTVASEPGQGTTVSLFLPRVAAPERAEPQQAHPLASPLPHGRADGLSILVVEDDPEVLDAVQFALVDAGHRVLTASDSAEALAFLAGHERVDLLLCDVMLPGGMSGIEIANAARRSRPELRVLLASGYGAEGLEPVSGYEVLTKPFSQAELLRRVASPARPATAG